MKTIFIAASALALTGCDYVDQAIASGKATVVAVDRDNGRCVVSFRKKKDTRLYVSVPSTPYKRMRCRTIQPGHTVQIATDPVIGDYPYILFESLEG
jgi:uncharacterized lipoprotein YajG